MSGSEVRGQGSRIKTRLWRVKGSRLDVLWYVETTPRVSLALLVPITHNLSTLARSICFSLGDQVGCRVQGQVGVILYNQNQSGIDV
jgi:hypothetical protein